MKQETKKRIQNIVKQGIKNNTPLHIITKMIDKIDAEEKRKIRHDAFCAFVQNTLGKEKGDLCDAAIYATHNLYGLGKSVNPKNAIKKTCGFDKGVESSDVSLVFCDDLPKLSRHAFLKTKMHESELIGDVPKKDRAIRHKGFCEKFRGPTLDQVVGSSFHKAVNKFADIAKKTQKQTDISEKTVDQIYSSVKNLKTFESILKKKDKHIKRLQKRCYELIGIDKVIFAKKLELLYSSKTKNKPLYKVTIGDHELGKIIINSNQCGWVAMTWNKIFGIKNGGDILRSAVGLKRSEKLGTISNSHKIVIERVH